jgi:hypothetical protein
VSETLPELSERVDRAAADAGPQTTAEHAVVALYDEDDVAFGEFLQEQKRDTATKAKNLLESELWEKIWEPVLEKVKIDHLGKIWKSAIGKNPTEETFLKALQNANDEQVNKVTKKLLESPPKQALKYVKADIDFESAECNELQILAGVALKDNSPLVNAQNRARLLVKAFDTKPLRPLSQTSSTTEGLGIGTWNIRAWGGMHVIPCYDDYRDKGELGVLPRKLESLGKLVSSCSLQLIALQECPGRAMGFRKGAHVEELLQPVTNALTSKRMIITTSGKSVRHCVARSQRHFSSTRPFYR